ncbi:Lst7p [Rhizophagus irregularis DAOM 197198w]|uniref:Folliculin n=1 Tax=Rhizophagus irregularis (strain DAOM 197198w) TaxID=1432141 RepID=A0A015N980_RHIIW|nr:Lst7p [Rhizophagus irregularis DAOM 197198w]
MNAIVSLVHFCEVDGPSVIFCTQAFHANSVEDISDELSVSSGGKSPSTGQTHSDSSKELLSNKKEYSVNTNRPAPASCASCAFSLPPLDSLSDAKTIHNSEIKGFKTRDEENPLVTYKGTRYPQDQQLYAAVRQACVRRELIYKRILIFPVFLNLKYLKLYYIISSLSCEFCQGREGPVLFGDDKNGYVLSYMFKIKDSQARGSQRWYSFTFLMTDRVYLVESWPFLVSKFRALATSIQSRANQIFEKENATKEEKNDGTFLTRSGPLSPTSPDQFLRRRANQPLRSLVDLLRSKDFFVQLHANFSWILKACGMRLQEKHLNDQTLFSNSVVFSSKTIMLLDPVATYKFPPSDFNCLEETRIEDLKALYNILGLDVFRKLILNFVMGNQLVIKGNDPKIVQSVISILKDLVPSECCSIMENENNYQTISKCNILGLNATAQIPNDVNKSTLYKAMTNAFEFNLQYGIDDKDNKRIYSAPNSFINQLIGILKLNLPSEIMNTRIMIFKEQWSSKAKQFLIFITKSNNEGGNALANMESTKQKEFIKYIDINENDLPIIKFWIGCLKTA